MRRQMHNMIQELRGNVSVIARVRPLLPGEDSVVDVPDVDKQTLAVSIPELDPRLFNFDRVFNEYASQENVFEEVSELVAIRSRWLQGVPVLVRSNWCG